MAVRASVLRSVLDEIWRCAQGSRIDLRSALDASNATVVTSAGGGQQIRATSGNGESVTFGNAFGLRPTDFLEATDSLKRLYDACYAALTYDAEDLPTDCELYACIKSKCVQRKRIRTCYDGIVR